MKLFNLHDMQDLLMVLLACTQIMCEAEQDEVEAASLQEAFEIILRDGGPKLENRDALALARGALLEAKDE